MGWLVSLAEVPNPGCGSTTGMKEPDSMPEISGFHCPLCCLSLAQQGTHITGLMKGSPTARTWSRGDPPAGRGCLQPIPQSAGLEARRERGDPGTASGSRSYLAYFQQLSSKE